MNAIVADEAFFKTATNPGGNCVAPDVVYDSETNPDGVRCSILDYMINIFGPRRRGGLVADRAGGRPRLRLASPSATSGSSTGSGALETA